MGEIWFFFPLPFALLHAPCGLFLRILISRFSLLLNIIPISSSDLLMMPWYLCLLLCTVAQNCFPLVFKFGVHSVVFPQQHWGKQLATPSRTGPFTLTKDWRLNCSVRWWRIAEPFLSVMPLYTRQHIRLTAEPPALHGLYHLRIRGLSQTKVFDSEVVVGWLLILHSYMTWSSICGGCTWFT